MGWLAALKCQRLALSCSVQIAGVGRSRLTAGIGSLNSNCRPTTTVASDEIVNSDDSRIAALVVDQEVIVLVLDS